MRTLNIKRWKIVDIDTHTKSAHWSTTIGGKRQDSRVGGIPAVVASKSGFWQVPIKGASEKFLAFSTPQGCYAYCKLPMDLSTSLEFFSKVLNKVLAGMDLVLIYVDDIVICTTVEEHTVVLRQVLQHLQNAGLTLNADKLQFYKNEIEFLGHVSSAKGISNSPEKLQTLRTTSLPKDN